MSARKDDPEAQLLGSSSTTQTPFLNQEPPSYSMIHEKAQSDARVCRICFDGESSDEASTNPLISPCLCSGSSSYVHRQVCHYEYQYKRLDGAAILAHPAFVAGLFSVLTLASCTILGFIPVVQACLAAYDVNMHSIGLAAVHFVDGLFLLGIVGFIWLVLSGADIRLPCRHCPIFFMPDAMSCTSCAGAGCGEVCGPLLLVVLALVAVTGLIMSIPLAISFLYEQVNKAAGKTVAMVENVPTPQKPLLQGGG